MKFNIDTLVVDDSLRKLLYLLEEIEDGADKDEVLPRAWRILQDGGSSEEQPNMYEILRMHLGDYESGIINLQGLKDDIFNTLEEYGQLKRTV